MASDRRRGPAPPAGRRPRYLEVAQRLRQGIRSGRWDRLLPPVEALAADLGVGRSTVREAIRSLEQEGWVRARQGAGTDILWTPQLSSGLEELTSTTELIRAAGHEPGTSAAEVHRLRASLGTFPDLAGRDVVAVERVRTADGVPFVQSLDVVLDLGWEDDHLRRTLRSGSLVELLEEGGRHLARAEATLSAVVASTDQARALSVAPGVPLLLITQLLFDQDGQLVGYSEDSYRTDLMTFRVVRRRGPRFDDTAGRDRIE